MVRSFYLSLRGLNCLSYLISSFSFILLPISFLLFPPLIFPWKNALGAVEMQSLNFYQNKGVSYLEMQMNGEGVKAKKFHVVEDKQIILDLEDVKANEKVLRGFDTSEFSGSVVFVSPYPRPGSEKDLRIALQLRDNVRSILKVEGTKITLGVENQFGMFTQNKLEESNKNELLIKGGGGDSKARVPKSEQLEDILENITYSGTKKYIGKKISVNVKDIHVIDVLKMIADSSGFNIIISEEVKSLPPLTLTLTNIPWDQALDTVLSLGKLVARKNGNILLVNTLAKATEEKKVEDAAREFTDKKEPLVTKIFPISFANLEEMLKILEEYKTKERGTISVDKRTNSLIVRDTANIIEKMRKIIETLDTQTPQILIEAKIVETAENYAKEIGLKDGLKFGYDPITPKPTSDTHQGPGFAFSSASALGEGGQGAGLFSFGISSYHRLLNLGLQLQLMESESKGKVISSPRVITGNNQEALLSSTETTSYKISKTGTDGRIEDSFETVDATLSLKVTPQVTNEGSIALGIDLARGGFGSRPNPNAPPNQTKRNVKTKVLVDNGSTIVIGGLYTFNQLESHSGVPFLKDLPLVGWLFRTAYNPSQQKNELIIFLTPRIINQEEAGLVERDDSMG